MKTSAPDLQKKFLSTPCAHFKTVDAEQGIVEAIVNTYGVVDYANERTIPGCCDKSLKAKSPTICWMHDWTQPVGKTLEAIDLKPGDARLPEKIRALGGLYVKGQFNLKTQRGKDAFYDLIEGVVDEFSIGYYEVKTKWAKDGVLDLEEIDLVEWSPVLRGCNPITMVLDAKNRNDSAPMKPTSKHQPTPPDDGRAHIKSQYLGYYAEGEAAIEAIYALNNRLFNWALYDNLYYYAEDEGETLEERLGEISAAFDEFRDISLSVVRALMTNVGEKRNETLASLKSLWFDPNSVLPAGAAYEKQLDATLAAVNACIARGKSIADLRAKDDRRLSDARVEQIDTLGTALAALVTEARKALPGETDATLLRQIARKHALRQATTTSTEQS